MKKKIKKHKHFYSSFWNIAADNMDDIHTFHKRSYEAAGNFGDLSTSDRAIMLAKLAPLFILKTLLVIALELFYLLLAAFHLIVPKKLKDIRAQLAVVGVIVRKTAWFQ